MKHCLIFSREIYYFTIVLCLNILRLKAVNEITGDLLLGKHKLAYINMTSQVCIIDYIQGGPQKNRTVFQT